MCGIIGHLGDDDDTVEALLGGLKNLEYRGYDSAGVAVQNGAGIDVRKRAGEVDELVEHVAQDPPCGNVGIGHTRWSTHGPPNDRNAHPHTSSTAGIAVVHNGVIENHGELRGRLEARGHEFTSDTDTEVIPRLFEEHLDGADDATAAFRRTVRDLEGSYAIAAIVDGVEAVFAARQRSPLVIGLNDGAYYVASDVPAFLEQTNDVIYLEDGDIAVLQSGAVTITDLDGSPVSRTPEAIDWDPDEVGKGSFDHYMLKEIHAQPTALANTLQGRLDSDAGEAVLDEFRPGAFADVTAVQLVGCGTSYHAALYGERLLARTNIRARAIRASEYENATGPVDEGTLFVAVTQSGETADTLDATRRATARGARTVAVTNVRGSTITREADDSVLIRAGPEIGVAATKTFSSQTVTLSLLANDIAHDAQGGMPIENGSGYFDALSSLPDHMDRLLSQTRAESVARRHRARDAVFFIGRGLDYPVAKEGALKFKEITYEHAEGFASGELKHGPLALVTPRTPVVAIFNGEHDDKTLTNAKQAQTRGARVIVVAPDGHPATDMADDHLWIPDTHPVLSSLLANAQLQLFAYHAADQLGRSIDKPRNLAKSVTVD